MINKTAVFLLIALLPAVSLHAQTASPKVETCADVPRIPSPSKTCVKTTCGPTYNTDRVFTNDPTSSNQIWEAWATLGTPRKVRLCDANGALTNTWVTKGSLALSPPAPPSTVVPPPLPTPAPTVSMPLTWVAPTTNSDGSALTDLRSYNVYIGTTNSFAAMRLLAQVQAPTATYTASGLALGVYYFAVTAVNSSQEESVPSNIISTGTPNAPTNLKAQ